MEDEQQTDVVVEKRGPGRPPNPKPPVAPQQNFDKPVGDEYDEITYCPGQFDPPRTEWNGVRFKANVPVKISKKQTVLVPLREEFLQPDGSRITRAVERRVPMVELAKGNHTFSVNGAEPVAHKVGTDHVPTSPDEYRGYAIAWISSSTKSSEMDARWDGEERLRDKCGVSEQDIAYLRPFFEAWHMQVKDRAA
jgi:hypothetical protein